MPGCQYCTERGTISCYGGLHIFIYIYIYIYSYFALGLQPGIVTSHTKNSTTASLNKLRRELYNRYSADDKYISLKKMRFKLNLNCPWRPNWQRTTFAWNNTSLDQWRFVRKCLKSNVKWRLTCYWYHTEKRNHYHVSLNVANQVKYVTLKR